jgi:hypothetical protein
MLLYKIRLEQSFPSSASQATRCLKIVQELLFHCNSYVQIKRSFLDSTKILAIKDFLEGLLKVVKASITSLLCNHDGYD